MRERAWRSAAAAAAAAARLRKAEAHGWYTLEQGGGAWLVCLGELWVASEKTYRTRRVTFEELTAFESATR